MGPWLGNSLALCFIQVISFGLVITKKYSSSWLQLSDDAISIKTHCSLQMRMIHALNHDILSQASSWQKLSESEAWRGLHRLTASCQLIWLSARELNLIMETWVWEMNTSVPQSWLHQPDNIAPMSQVSVVHPGPGSSLGVANQLQKPCVPPAWGVHSLSCTFCLGWIKGLGSKRQKLDTESLIFQGSQPGFC